MNSQAVNREPKETAQAALDALKLTISAEFVPWSQSRNKGEKHRSLNWRVTVKRDGRDILTTDYSAGVGHCSKQTRDMRPNYEKQECEKFETERGLGARYRPWGILGAEPILPDMCDVISSLVLDASVLDSPTFEDWASNFGYDADSRKGEAIYRACLEIALKMRAAIGDSGLAALREAFQDY